MTTPETSRAVAMANVGAWQLFCDRHVADPATGIAVDLSRMGMPDEFLAKWAIRMQAAFGAMDRLEAGDIANADEKRMVGHYWLRAPQRAPHGLTPRIEQGIADVESFAREVLDGGAFDQFLLVGIGGSMLGPQFLMHALDAPAGARKLQAHFIDNTDPDGIDRTLRELAGKLDRTLTIVASKSGGTPETQNGMLEVAAAYRRAGVDFPSRAVAVTELFDKPEDFKRLQRRTVDEGWLKLFPMFDWIGGRTSVCSPVGLLPLALGGIDVRSFLAGAARMDDATRRHVVADNPAALVALSWLFAGDGKGGRAMVVLPYSDRLALLSKYLQQLIMESLGKEFDRKGRAVHQGLTVFGNKGSTDQHSYLQQLRDGSDAYFAVFVEVLERMGVQGTRIDVDPETTSEDYLHAFLLGTRQALWEKSRPSTTIALDRVSPDRVGSIIALFERTVGLYAELVDVNAYHQPGVEAGKKAAGAVLELQRAVVEFLRRTRPATHSAVEIANELGRPGDDAETIYLVLRRLVQTGLHGVHGSETWEPVNARFAMN